MDTALNRIKRKLEAAELQHLREHCAYLDSRIELLDERAQRAEEQAEWYWQEWRNLIDQMMEEGQQPMLTKTGEVIPESSASFIFRALVDAIDFMAGFEDDPEQDLGECMKRLRSARDLVCQVEIKP